ncbi:MAG: hypothetical protein HY721_28740 [Planctomycetes bacterium]|nr:hypothetical protein [Planctomycetota bacterium]
MLVEHAGRKAADRLPRVDSPATGECRDLLKAPPDAAMDLLRVVVDGSLHDFPTSAAMLKALCEGGAPPEVVRLVAKRLGRLVLRVPVSLETLEDVVRICRDLESCKAPGGGWTYSAVFVPYFWAAAKLPLDERRRVELSEFLAGAGMHRTSARCAAFGARRSPSSSVFPILEAEVRLKNGRRLPWRLTRSLWRCLEAAHESGDAGTSRRISSILIEREFHRGRLRRLAVRLSRFLDTEDEEEQEQGARG